jgi:hypothetical protein
MCLKLHPPAFKFDTYVAWGCRQLAFFTSKVNGCHRALAQKLGYLAISLKNQRP